MKNYNKLTLSPSGCGVIDGAYVKVNNKGKFFYEHSKTNEVKKFEKLEKINKIFFLRGILLFFYNIYKFFECIDKSYTTYNEYLLSNPVVVKNKKRGEYVRFYTWVLVFLLIFFIGLPLGTNILFDVVIKSTFWKGFLNVFFKIVFIISFFCMLRFLEKAREIYKYNYAINQVANAYTSQGLDYTKLKLANGYRVFNNFNFFILGLVLLYVFLPLFTFNINIVFNILIKIAVGLVILSVSYEIIYVIQYRVGFCPVAKFLSFPMIAISYLTSCKCEQEKLALITSAVEELSHMNIQVEKQKNNGIAFSEVYKKVKQTLSDSGIMEIAEADNLICDTLNIKRTELINLQTLTKTQYNKIIKVLERRKQREPLNKILKNQNFYGLDFYINEDCLAPRQETEILVEQAIKYINSLNKVPKVLDMCTGSGVIAICIAKQTKAKITATDISAKALAVATKNAKIHKVNINFEKSDAFKGLKPTDKFDIIISNPPYIKTQDIDGLDEEVKFHDPIIALDGGVDGLNFYRIFAENAYKHIRSGGVIMLEIGEGQADLVTQLLQNNFKDIKILKDYSGIQRVVIATKKE